ncbi:MAG: ACT domain-containing protein [Candidatus Peribacteraceae bacterium]|nr:ACT domain-containing protein [Candidatus Peribacteraceae bacterium]MDD5742611.1 ACT domain-containing protein [Candidatus Peribacteraceae bacterium]
MVSELEGIIRQSTFSVVDGAYIYAKVAAFPANGDHFLVTKDSDEITVVTRAEYVSALSLIERNKDEYALVALNVSIPFYSVGFIAAVSAAIADKGMNILVVSTYSKDYILVMHDKLQEAIQVLINMGFSQN